MKNADADVDTRPPVRRRALKPAFPFTPSGPLAAPLRRPASHAVAALIAAVCACGPLAAHAAVALLQPPREAAASEPLELTLLYSADDAAPLHATVPPTLRVTLTNGDQPPAPLELRREPGVPDTLTLEPGQYRKVRFRAPWPAAARGAVRVDTVGFDASPSLVVLNRGPDQLAVIAAEQAQSETTTSTQTTTSTGAAPAATVGAIATPADTLSTTSRNALDRLSFYEPIYVAAGKNGDTSARFQLSFKYRILMPDDLRSKRFVDNLYFAYTQTSIWDLSATSAPFRDTSYEPQLFYYLADTGWASSWYSRMGIAAGVGHESNGKSGDDSRGINIVFVRPTWEFGDLTSTHLTVSPKLYYYLSKHDNPDIAAYRGYADLLVKYGSPDGLQLATTLRKGTKHWYGSVDAQLTYPLARLLGSAWGGYLWVGYFNGYGEDILDYNRRQHWIARIGYSIAR
ncbi:phospholipase A [Paraburkholderia caballeronis]|uniref:Phospholipase A1 n=1 Tax=Paraburkholderia caballeronis TaxID=416943 RepID=A0A1H7IZ52_9BURK|nr:phospholipase A [Paraburkholderia caballeronis]PXW27656.1 phospholipase A1-like protein [Paraburkholderia caballeronis]PXX03130.1 phospholipase A1-like protein [Paraburkholderia caballeronis]RAK03855.1 phospholipase A1-like protein [Paraburkholderia caballeronis]SEC15341.1 Phospholipase A1 [Paraburkholderia caballeronis]SEK66917.1 Phospholipase A1 [Paraburkholderia caballeronis]